MPAVVCLARRLGGVELNVAAFEGTSRRDELANASPLPGAPLAGASLPAAIHQRANLPLWCGRRWCNHNSSWRSERHICDFRRSLLCTQVVASRRDATRIRSMRRIGHDRHPRSIAVEAGLRAGRRPLRGITRRLRRPRRAWCHAACAASEVVDSSVAEGARRHPRHLPTRGQLRPGGRHWVGCSQPAQPAGCRADVRA